MKYPCCIFDDVERCQSACLIYNACMWCQLLPPFDLIVPEQQSDHFVKFAKGKIPILCKHSALPFQLTLGTLQPNESIYSSEQTREESKKDSELIACKYIYFFLFAGSFLLTMAFKRKSIFQNLLLNL